MSPLDAAEPEALAEALIRNLWAGTPPEDATAAPRLAARAIALDAALAAQPMAALSAGRLAFPKP